MNATDMIDDGTTSHESEGHAPGSYRASMIGVTIALVGIGLCGIYAVVVAIVEAFR